jgi:hypothetical protein
MGLGLLIVLGLLAGLIIGLRWSQRRGWIDLSGEKTRRGVGHAMLGLQGFIEPSVEHVFEVQNAEQKEEDDLDTGRGDLAAIREDLAASLRRSPIDLEEVRRQLTAAQRAGLDWRTLYDEAVRAEVKERLYRAPSIPPPWRVAPRP